MTLLALAVIVGMIFSPVDGAKVNVVEISSAQCSILLAVFWYRTPDRPLLLRAPKCYSLLAK